MFHIGSNLLRIFFFKLYRFSWILLHLEIPQHLYLFSSQSFGFELWVCPQHHDNLNSLILLCESSPRCYAWHLTLRPYKHTGDWIGSEWLQLWMWHYEASFQLAVIWVKWPFILKGPWTSSWTPNCVWKLYRRFMNGVWKSSVYIALHECVCVCVWMGESDVMM